LSLAEFGKCSIDAFIIRDPCWAAIRPSMVTGCVALHLQPRHRTLNATKFQLAFNGSIGISGIGAHGACAPALFCCS
jgi:hypothetical protein